MDLCKYLVYYPTSFPGRIMMLLRGSERLSSLSGVTQRIRSMIPTLAHPYSGPRVTLNDC